MNSIVMLGIIGIVAISTIGVVHGIPSNLHSLSPQTQAQYWKCIDGSIGAGVDTGICDYIMERYGTQFDEWNKCVNILGEGICNPRFPEITTPGGIQKQESENQSNEKTDQKRMIEKDCPATQHLYNGICEDNADGKAHPSADNPNRSSRLDCARNEFACRSSGEIK